MSLLKKAILLAFLLAPVFACSQNISTELKSTVAGSPHYCRNEIGQIEISYRVQNIYTNTTPKSLVVRLGLSRVLSFSLFSELEHIDAASAVYQSSQDSVKSPPFKRKILKPKESVEWSAVATITIDGQESSTSRLPRPGEYFLLPFPDIEAEDHSVPLDERSDGSRLLPITIAKPNFDPPLCGSRNK